MSTRVNVLMSGVAVLLCVASVHASVTFQTVSAALGESQMMEATLIDLVYGPDASSTLTSTFSLNPTTGSFTSVLDSGQTYLGQPVSLSTTGTYNSGTGQYQWTSTAQLGTDTWTSSSFATWTGDPTISFTGTVTINGTTYTVQCTGEVDGMGHLDPATVTGSIDPGGQPLGPFDCTGYIPGSADGKVILKVKTSKTGDPHNVQVDDVKYEQVAQATLNQQTGEYIDGHATMHIEIVPEPATIMLLVAGGLGLLRCRKRGN